MTISVHIDYAADDSCQIRLWARGTHAPEAFHAACEKALKQWDGREVSLAGMPIRHEHWRSVPADAETRALGVCDRLNISSKPGRGAYAVTALGDWLPLHPPQPALVATVL